MKGKSYLLFILTFSIFYSCSNKQEIDEFSEIHIEIPVKQLQKVKMSDFISDFKAVKLEFTENSMLHSIRKIIRYKEMIYVLDIFGAKGVLVYDMNGKFIRKIGSVGRGPGQYAMPQDFIIDTDTNEIEIIGNRKIIYFALNGQYLKESTIEFTGTNFLKKGNEYYIAIGGREDYKVVRTDENGIIKAHYLPTYSNYQNGEAFSCFIPLNMQEILFRPKERDTIYLLTLTDAIPHTIIDFGDYKLKIDEFNKLDHSQKAAYYKRGQNINQCIIRNYFENSNYIHMVYNMSGTFYEYILNKKTERHLHFSNNTLTDDIIGSKDSRWITGGDEEYVYYVIEPYKFKSTKQLREFYERFTNDENYIKEMLEETSNPIILFAKYKL